MMELPVQAEFPTDKCLTSTSAFCAGEWEVQISKQPGTLSVTVQDGSGAAQHPDHQQQAPLAPFAFDMSLDGLQLDLWDDERRRLSGGRLSDSQTIDGSAAPPAQRSSMAGTALEGLPRQLGARLFCISLDRLGLAVSRRHTPGNQKLF